MQQCKRKRLQKFELRFSAYVYKDGKSTCNGYSCRMAVGLLPLLHKNFSAAYNVYALCQSFESFLCFDLASDAYSGRRIDIHDIVAFSCNASDACCYR